LSQRTARFALCVGLALLAWGETSAAGSRQRTGAESRPSSNKTKSPRPRPRHPSLVGNLRYDNDVPFSRDGTLAVPVGNRFDPPPSLSVGSFYQITFRLAGCFSTPYVEQRISIFDIDPTAMQLQLVRQFSGGGSCVSTAGAVLRTAVLPSPILPPVRPFVAAIQNTAFAGCEGNTGVGGTCEGVALSAGGQDPGLGFHAIRVAGLQSTLPNLGDRNAIFRAQFFIFPVELMNFDVE
jgi:hypothetical protein